MEEKKEAKVRTSITIDPDVLKAAREHCEAARVSVSSFIEDALRAKLPMPVSSSEAVELVTADGS
jgi:hypothetical protein